MSWLAYALTTVVLWTGWSFIGVLALRTVSAGQATLVFGISTIVVGPVGLAVGGAWAAKKLWDRRNRARAAVPGGGRY